MKARIPTQLRVLFLWTTALFGAAAPLWPAQAPILGDLNGDGVVNVQDLALLVNHLQAVRFLPASAVPYADINQDGVVSETDVETLVGIILERHPERPLPLTRVLTVSPTNGELNVSPTRETIVRFTMPLAENTLLTNDNLYATFGGRRLLTRVELSSDRMKATLFYLEYLPSAARVRVTFDASGVSDFLGRGLDGSGDGLPGGLRRVDFETLSYAPVANTGVVGTVYAAAPDANGENVPLQGVILEVIGDEERTRTTTGADGRFHLTPVPAGRFFVNIDGRPITGGYPNNGYYPFIGKAWTAVAGRQDNPVNGTGEIFLPYIPPQAMRTVSAVAETVVDFAPVVLQQNPELAGTEVRIPPNSLFADDGTRGGSVGIAPVPPDRLPEPLPPGLDLPLVITIQTDGATNFDIPVPVRLPNTPDPVTGERLAPGTRSALWSFNHDTGDWEIAGPMRVTADGNFLVTEPGVGVRQPGWHGQRPGSQGGGGGGDGDGDDFGDSDDFDDFDGGDEDADADADDFEDLDEDSDEDADEDADEDDEEDCEDDAEDCECEEGDIRSAASVSVSIPTGAINRFSQALSRIPRITAKVDAVQGSTGGWMQDCCPEGATQPISNGKMETSTSLTLNGTVEGQVWGPPIVRIQADFKVVRGTVLLEAGVFVFANPSVGGSFGAKRNDCINERCAFFEFSANLSIGLEARVKATAEGCIGWWCGGFNIEVVPASIAANFKGGIKVDSCEGVTGTIGLDSIVFSCALKAYGISVGYSYKIYP
ncbi:MAG: dockerin type I repeat-containing protein [Opitutales bacterium]|nr:dockerin type I repeat-containing protein [Opitutales bacterium]